MRLKDCFEKGLLRKRRPDTNKSMRAMELADKDLGRARKLLESGFFMESRLLSYTGMFQAARALLYRDGVFERSHVCVVEYLKAKYVKEHVLDIAFVNWLNALRVTRHESLYGLDLTEVPQEDAEDALDKAAQFIRRVSEIL